MRPISTIKIVAYEVGVEDWCVDISETEDGYDAWIYRKDCCVKEHMFGCSRVQATGPKTLDGFIELVKWNFLDYARDYDNAMEG